MSRAKNKIPRWISIDMQQLLVLQAQMSNNEDFGAFCRKAVIDLCSGCVANDVCDSVLERYKHAVERMEKRQQVNANYYKSSKQDAGTGNSPDDRKAPPSCTISGDAAIREDAVNYATPQGALLESGTSPVTIDDSAKPSTEQPLSFVEVSGKSQCTAVAKPEKKPYGENRHVMLTDEEGAKLRDLYGADLAIAINILDCYIENDGKAAKRYKSHYSVLRRGNWVWEKVQNTKLAEKRLENASKGQRNYKAEEREAMARFIRGESVNHDSKVSDAELSQEELRQFYG